jgi:hypothetical protein
LKCSKHKIDFFIALHRAMGKAGIGLPAKSRAPALVAGWAPRISQKPCFGARLFLLKIGEGLFTVILRSSNSGEVCVPAICILWFRQKFLCWIAAKCE